jgi:hypothetical protein
MQGSVRLLLSDSLLFTPLANLASGVHLNERRQTNVDATMTSVDLAFPHLH